MNEMRQAGAGSTSSASVPMTEVEFRSMYQRLRDGRPWGPDDRRGALNHLTQVETLAAAAEVTLGRAVGLSAPIEGEVTADNPRPARHHLEGSAEQAARGVSFSLDRIDMNVHGNADSHLDALCHVIFDGESYNGVRPGTPSESGGTELSVATAADGIVGRGVLLDIPRTRGVAWLEPGDHVTVDDVLAAELDQDVHVGRGDILLVRVGHRQRRSERGPWNAAEVRAGLHPEVVPLLAERRVAVLGSDGNNDTAPSLTEHVDFPVHVLAVNALGLMLLDYLDFEDLVPVCEETRRWSFLCILAPLRLPAGTGSPVNPIAVF